MNLPNRLTLARIILIPIILVFMLPSPLLHGTVWNHFLEQYGMLIALLVFALASYTDHLDGSIARRTGQVTNLGKFLDPIADKVLVLSVLIAFSALDRCPAIIPIIVLFREFAVTGIRLLSIERGTVIAASYLGKAKTVTQMLALICLMLESIAERLYMEAAPLLRVLVPITLVICVILTIWSGVDYLVKNLYLFKESTKE